MRLRPRRQGQVSNPSSVALHQARDLTTDFADPQQGCPLFTRIPPELRNRIFYFAVLSYDNTERPYPSNAFYYRPDYRYYGRIDTALLQTCKLIYLETRLLPVIANEHVSWCHRAPPNTKFGDQPFRYFLQFTEEQKDVIDRVHLFTQMFWLENDFPRLCGLEALRPRLLHITIRQSDWWWWEQNRELTLKDVWASRLGELKRLEVVVLELEAIERDKERLYAIADRLNKQQFKLYNGRKLSTTGNALLKEQWMGPTVYESGHRYNKELKLWGFNHSKQLVADPGMKYCTVTLKWTAT